MTLKIRRSIFYTLIIIFLILAFFIIPYSNGWRFDFSSFSFVKLGGLYLNVEPAEAKIQVSPLAYVLGAGVNKLDFEIKSGFMKSGILIANLFPKTYSVSVQKSGYQSWNKNVTVRPSLITQVHQIILIPENIDKNPLIKNVKDFFPNTDYLAWKDDDNKLKIDGKIIKGSRFLTWLTGEKFGLVYDEAAKNYLVINAGQNNTALNINLLFDNLKYQKEINPRTYKVGEGVNPRAYEVDGGINDNGTIEKIIGHPFDKNKLILTTNEAIYILDFYKPSLEMIYSRAYKVDGKAKKGQYDLLAADGKEIFFTDSNSLYSYNLIKEESSVLIKQKNVSLLEISSNNQFLAFSSDNKLMLLDRTKSENGLISLIENPAYFKFSPDSKKIAVVYDNNKIKIFFIGDDYELFNKKQMGYSFFDTDLLDLSSPIAWHANSSYIFVKNKTDLKFLEIDDDSPINLQTIDTDIDKYFYNSQENSVYLMKSGSLYKIIE